MDHMRMLIPVANTAKMYQPHGHSITMNSRTARLMPSF